MQPIGGISVVETIVLVRVIHHPNFARFDGLAYLQKGGHLESSSVLRALLLPSLGGVPVDTIVRHCRGYSGPKNGLLPILAQYFDQILLPAQVVHSHIIVVLVRGTSPED